MAKLIWTEPALAQLESILDYIALDKPEAAQTVARRIFEATDRLETFTRLGRPVPELPHPNYHQVWMKPCWIYYRIDRDDLYILHVHRGEKLLLVSDLLRD